MARHLAQIIVLGAQMVGRALVKTLKQEMEASREAARMHQALRTNKSDPNDVPVKGMTLMEAQQILNVKGLEDRQEIDSHYRHLFGANEKPAGGSFYIQSKVYRAKERIDQELTKQSQSKDKRAKQGQQAHPDSASGAQADESGQNKSR
ncbi:mitochondrial import inner membrane translocase subunit tim16 [Drosophila bipectinata]|uniref:mitochondrial import inner membrane translocase subunit tim16 n=1 Tax=Drosophila bipectinata TaxID=42026 RepID=UPI001C8A9C47|nr:mitochondrial import inner membrane translocase subunit tim16 [Drosophila bipectinata]